MCKNAYAEGEQSKRGKKEAGNGKSSILKKVRVLCSRHILDQTVETLPSAISYVRVFFMQDFDGEYIK